MTTTQKAVLLHPMGSMGEAIADECQAMGAWGRSLIDTPEYRAGQAEMNLRARNLLVHGISHPEALLPAETEVPGAEWSGIPGDPFVNLTRVVTEPAPWDFAAGESS